MPSAVPIFLLNQPGKLFLIISHSYLRLRNNLVLATDL